MHACVNTLNVGACPLYTSPTCDVRRVKVVDSASQRQHILHLNSKSDVMILKGGGGEREGRDRPPARRRRILEEKTQHIRDLWRSLYVHFVPGYYRYVPII